MLIKVIPHLHEQNWTMYVEAILQYIYSSTAPSKTNKLKLVLSTYVVMMMMVIVMMSYLIMVRNHQLLRLHAF